ncbi:UDP-glucose/GDP-mannose dehydrogenase family protein [Kitasatospora sp. NPDC089797]|uniref:UDP-glucose dehydrogenase family protein n=1 Tax=Kitasatospora sp. NPDC089797 TaxID=3155298 RepID=UPI003437D98B
MRRQLPPTPPAADRPRLSFVGTGYLGTTYAACYAELGHRVVGLDTDPARIAALAAGDLPFHEPGLADLLRRGLDSGRLSFTTDPAVAAAGAEAHFLCVGTPQRADGTGADLGQVASAVRALAPHLHGRTLVVGKSTVPVGTAEWVERLLRKHVPDDADPEVAWCPEFLREGRAVEDVLRPDRIVIGARGPWARDTLARVHRGVYRLAEQEGREVPTVQTDFATAELVKSAANAFLATKISFINAMAELCEATGADVAGLAEALGHDGRIGPRFLRAGVGFGGGCLPKDIRALQARAHQLGAGAAVRFLHEVDLINQRRRERVLQLAGELLDCLAGPAGPELAGARVAVLGAAFKPDSDDVRDAPALAVARMLHGAGAEVRVYDPLGRDNARRSHPELGYADGLEQACADADLVCVLTEWQEFRDADPAALAHLVNGRIVIDGRNCLDRRAWRAAGWTYRGLGWRETA